MWVLRGRSALVIAHRRDQAICNGIPAGTILEAVVDESEGPMGVRRAVADFKTHDIQESLEFYVGVLGFEVAMNLGWIATVVSPSNPSAQISFLTHDKSAPVVPDLSVEVEDVDAVYEKARDAGLEVVHALTDEAWGVRRFLVRDPNGRVVNVMQHLPPSE